jgi:rRNA processing protein Krr1/Pno1
MNAEALREGKAKEEVFEDPRSLTDASRVVNAIGIGVPPSKIRNSRAAAMDEVVTMADVGGQSKRWRS